MKKNRVNKEQERFTHHWFTSYPHIFLGVSFFIECRAVRNRLYWFLWRFYGARLSLLQVTAHFGRLQLYAMLPKFASCFRQYKIMNRTFVAANTVILAVLMTWIDCCWDMMKMLGYPFIYVTIAFCRLSLWVYQTWRDEQTTNQWMNDQVLELNPAIITCASALMFFRFTNLLS